ncbi:hypothetical protein D9M68_990920 [compost metagenome]
MCNHPQQRLLRRQPAAGGQIRRQVAHHAVVGRAQLQALALRDQTAVFGHGFGQVLLEDGAVGHRLATRGLTPQLQLQDCNFAAHDLSA